MSEFDWDSLKKRHREKTAGLGDLEVDDYDEGLFDLENRVSVDLENRVSALEDLFSTHDATRSGEYAVRREFASLQARVEQLVEWVIQKEQEEYEDKSGVRETYMTDVLVKLRELGLVKEERDD